MAFLAETAAKSEDLISSETYFLSLIPTIFYKYDLIIIQYYPNINISILKTVLTFFSFDNIIEAVAIILPNRSDLKNVKKILNRMCYRCCNHLERDREKSSNLKMMVIIPKS